MKNILALTLGMSWQIVPELYGFTNPEDYNFYKNHKNYKEIISLQKQYNIKPIKEIWIATTDNKESVLNIENLRCWHNNLKNSKNIKIKIFVLKGVEDTNSIDECRQMGDLIYKMVFAAKRETNGGQLILSLSGGRKTMSADMQEAGNIFGCYCMVHILNTGRIPETFQKNSLIDIPDKNTSSIFVPVVTFGTREENIILSMDPSILKNENFFLKTTNNSLFEITELSPEINLYEEIEKRKKTSVNVAYNFYVNISQKEASKNFYSLYFLSPLKIEFLKNKKISISDYNLIKKLPKTELHCHLGGIAYPEEIIEIAFANKDKIFNLRKQNNEYDSWLKDISQFVREENINNLSNYFQNPKNLRKKFSFINEPYAVAGFLIEFKENPQLLKELIYNNVNNNFFSIGINQYEQLGDFQGSALLQTRESIEKACDILLKKCRENNVKYIEIRCSPLNYTRGELSAEEVINIFIKKFYDISDIVVKLIFIGSRHREINIILKHINIAQKFLERNDKFEKIFVGFDLAGEESFRSPSELRKHFLPLMEKCLHITIHAGETESVENIWEAVYHLNADRIGHGLTLYKNKELMNKIFERKISIEMCPSSNFQIVGFNDFFMNISNKQDYPLKKYLENGLRVTVNTDNIGISLTDFSMEYVKASQMTKDGLSLWNILQIIRNGFISGFCQLETKKNLITNSEKEIMKIISEVS